jgi:hypothetical protein
VREHVLEVTGERVQAVGVDQQRDVDPRHDLAHQRLRVRVLGQARAEHDRVRPADRLEHRLDARRIEVPVAVLGQPDHHRFQQSNREAQL